MKEIHPMVSIIIPIYNTEECLPQCLDSVLSQSFTDWELLLVDDGSTDNSGLICDEYACSDSRIQVFHRVHGGASAARNHGLDSCRGTFLTFVDSDDVLLSADFLQELYDLLIQHEADATVCGSCSFNYDDPGPPKGTFFPGKPETFFSGIKVASGRDYLLERDNPSGYSPIFVTKTLFRRDVFRDIRFPEGIAHEDIAVSAHVFYPCTKIVMIGKRLYGVRRHPKMATDEISRIKNYLDFIEAQDIKKQYLLQQNESVFVLRITRAMEKYIGIAHLMAKKIDEPQLIPPKYRVDDTTSFRHIITAMGFHTTENFVRHLFPGDNDIQNELLNEEKLLSSLCRKLALQVLTGNERVPWEEIEKSIMPLLRVAWDEGVTYMICESLQRYDQLDGLYRQETESIQKRLIRDWILNNEKEKNSLREARIREGYVPLDLHLLDDLYPSPWYRSGGINHSLFSLHEGEWLLQILHREDSPVYLCEASADPGSYHVLVKNDLTLTPAEIRSILEKHIELSEDCKLADSIDLQLYLIASDESIHGK